MKPFRRSIVLVPAFLAVLSLGLSAQDKPNPDQILGAWLLEVSAGGAVYYLPLELKLVEGKITGALSEQTGMFSNAPLTEVSWDGTTFKADTKILTPDGAEQLCKLEMKLAEDKFVGTLTIEGMGMSVPVTGTKK
jgi:hypothetical protein